ncbi:hypothetical protein [Microlunatus parietis]|uniref:Putative membrane protein n=1 Tax=Microlunatus parietis TaxID=682979 RepID=A0A7Y9IDS4_9ACTN|nr:hypothetical protein [Microlunatus parietis]NYE75012.1 putative membrane protein [Microlunatus parietis]
MSQAPPPRSPDGQWWWDGRQWLPVQQQPPHPGPPNGPRRSAAPLIILVAVVAAVVIIGLVAGGTLWIRSLQAATETTAPPPTDAADRSRPSPSPSPSPSGPGPVRCQARTSEGCFPKVSVGKLVAALRSKGFQCEKSGSYGTRCTKRISSRDQHTYALNHSLRDADRLTSLMALGSASAVGTDPPDRTGQANRRTVEALQLGLDLVLPAAGPTRRKIADWARDHQGRCADTFDVHQVIDGYELRCSNPEPIAVSDKQVVTTWSGSVTIGAGRLR